MSACSTASRGHDGHQNGLGSTVLSYRSQTASPTLTNPDMILPDYDEPESLDADPMRSPLVLWNDLQTSNDFSEFSQLGFSPGSLPHATPIIYGNGTMLSDIGEVTEVESTVGYEPNLNDPTWSRPSTSTNTSSGTPLRSSPTMGKKTLKKRPQRITKRERPRSLESTSSVSTIGGPEAAYVDIDDSVSVDDSNFQGDDEQSLASEFVDDFAVRHPDTTNVPPIPDQNENRFSMISISKRAEEILANAKRRLTDMEGNLNKARTFSYSSASDGSTPSPTARANPSYRDMTQSSTPGHSRNLSEDCSPSASQAAKLPQRSASALGVAGGYRQQVATFRSVDNLGRKAGYSARRSPPYSGDSILEPLDENDVQGMSSPVSGSYADDNLARSASVAQVRDLQDQMQDLKGKISSLRDQARADSMKRRSLQSLRALSPFTHARWDQGYVSQNQSPEMESADSGSQALVKPPNDSAAGHGNNTMPSAPVAEQISTDKENDESSVNGFREAPETQDEAEPPRHAIDAPEVVDGEEATTTQNAYDEGNDEVGLNDGVSESGESLYHETQQEPGDISHEDREDAFDYERFFLHSAMGSLSRHRSRRSGSFSSEESNESVETTRGPAMPARRPSIDTMVSVDSFATATEGRESRSSVAPPAGTSNGFVTPTLMANGEDDDYVPVTAVKRPPFGGVLHDSGSGSGSGSDSTGNDGRHARLGSVMHRPICADATSMAHRPSVSSFESTGTNRSFPLINKAKPSEGILTPSDSGDGQLKQVAESLLHETASLRKRDSSGSGGPQSPAMQILPREDQLLVEQVVASLGRCVLGLSDAIRRGNGKHDEFRRKIDAARRMLESVHDGASVSST